MNTRLLILGLNILVVSLLLVVYGVLVGDNGLVGVAVSLGIVGGVLVVYSTTPQDPSIMALTSYSEILVNATTSALEDLDLLEPSICAIRRADLTLLVYSKTPCPVEVDPGLGFTSGSPYLAIPVKTPIELTESSSEPVVIQLERNLVTLLVDEYSACRSVRVEEEGGFIRVYITGLAETLRQYCERPVDPYALLVLALASSILGARCIRLVDKKATPDGLILVLGVEQVGEKT